MELEENSFSFEKLLEKYPSDEYTQNLINRIITGITASVIVVNDRLLPIRKLDYIAPDSLEVTVPKISSSDKELKVDRTLEISIYESEVEIRCNYFEFLEFLHDTANQDIFLTPMDLEILPEAEVPYGITAKVKLLTFGFDGIKPDKF